MVLLLGDGAFGFSGMEFDTLARHGVAVVGVIGNNGIWGLEKHPMEAIYGYSVAADLRPGTRYDEVAAALGCHGELVRAPDELRPALERAFAAGRAGARQRADRSEHRLSAALEPRLIARNGRDLLQRLAACTAQPRGPAQTKTARITRAASDPGLAQSGRAGVRARKGQLEWFGRREAPMSAASPEPMLGSGRRLAVRTPRIE